MATYQLVMNNTWDDPAFQEWGVDAKLLFINLITSHRHNPLGLYAVTLKTLSAETSIPMDRVELALQELQRPIFGYARVRYDPDRCVVWIVNALKHQKGITPQTTPVLKHLVSIVNQHRDCPLLQELFSHYQQRRELSWMVNYLEGASKGLRKGYVGATKPLYRIGKDRIGKDRTSSKEGGVGETNGFAAFYEAYPRKTAKQEALKAWKRLGPDAALQTQILAALAAQKAWPQWTKDDGQFIPHPATWLNQRRWEDQPSPADQVHLQRAIKAKKMQEILHGS